MFRAIEVIAPPGTIANVVLPGACAARGLTGFRMVDCCFGALAMMVPDQVFAASDGGNTGHLHRRLLRRPQALHLCRFHLRHLGWAALCRRARRQLEHVCQYGFASVEVTEAEQPIQILAYEFMADRGGAGQVSRRYAVSVANTVSWRMKRYCRCAPTAADPARIGLYGGSPGKPSSNDLNPDRDNRTLRAKLTMTIRRGEVFRHEMAGAGGWGDPLERDPEAVLEDVRNELIIGLSAPRATTAWWSTRPIGQVDAAATRRLRERMRARLVAGEVPRCCGRIEPAAT